MSETRKTAPLRSKIESRRAQTPAKEETSRRTAVRKVLAGREVNSDTARIIEDTAVKYARALKHLADR
jgi:hypothetical protein